jgi:hypothetical protein
MNIDLSGGGPLGQSRPKAHLREVVESGSPRPIASKESLRTPVDRMWKAARISRNVRPNYSPNCCGKTPPCGRWALAATTEGVSWGRFLAALRDAGEAREQPLEELARLTKTPSAPASFAAWRRAGA